MKPYLLTRDVKWLSPFGFGLALAGRGLNGLGQKKLKFFRAENIAPNPIGFRVKRTKTSYKSNYKFKSKILKQNAQIVQIKYIYINLKLDNKSHIHNL